MRKHSIIVLLISLVAAFIFWLYVVTTIAPDTTGSINGVYVDVSGDAELEANGLMISNFSARKIRVELESSRAILSKLNSNNVTAVIDVSRITEPGEYPMSYTIKFPETVNPGEISILSKSSDEITIRVERIATKTISITPAAQNQQVEGCVYSDTDVRFEPESVTIRGLEDEVNGITQAVVMIDLSERDDTFELDSSLVFLNEENEEITLSNVTANVETVHTIVPILWRNDVKLEASVIYGSGISKDNVEITLSPDITRVIGSKAAIQKLGDTFVIGELDLSKMNDGDEAEFTIDLSSIDSSLYTVGTEKVTATVRFIGLTEKKFAVDDITFENSPPGLIDEYNKNNIQTVDVTLRGRPDILRSITKDKIHLTVDLSSLTQSGDWYVDAKVVIDGNPDVTVVGKVDVYVHLIAK